MSDGGPSLDDLPGLAAGRATTTIIAGLGGIERMLGRPEICDGNTWGDTALSTTSPLNRSIDRFAEPELAPAAFGKVVHGRLLGTVRGELQVFDYGCVTDWELVRYYERI